MREIKENQAELIIPFDESSLSSPQIRLLKSLNVAVMKALTANREEEFFKSCEEVMKICAHIAGQSSFPRQKAQSRIPYARQALEMAMESLIDELGQKFTRHDN